MGLREKMERAAWRAGGGTKTRQDRQGTARDYALFCRSQNIQTKNPEDIKSRHVERYVDYLKTDRGLKDRTIQKHMGHLRGITGEAGGRKLPTNTDLGIESERRPARVALTDANYEKAGDRLTDRGSDAERAGLGMMRWLGLRDEEVVKCADSLPHMERQLENGEAAHITQGTKGGRPRWSQPADREKALAAVREARAALERSGRAHLISGSTALGAKSRLVRELRQVGLEGRQSPHSARYAFAQDRLQAYRDLGYSERAARAATSLDMGHGDERGRWVHSVYSAKGDE